MSVGSIVVCVKFKGEGPISDKNASVTFCFGIKLILDTIRRIWLNSCKGYVLKVEMSKLCSVSQKLVGSYYLFWLGLICPELGVAPLVDPGTDVEDERPTQVGSLSPVDDGAVPLSVPSGVDMELVHVSWKSVSCRRW